MRQYFLFGKHACELYLDYGLDSLMEWCKLNDGDFQIYSFDQEQANGADLLFAFNGWEEYAVLNEEEFLILKANGLC